ncbi:MAG: hypothetical protein WCY00_01425 [Candidatus Dojkabacteria bacterium]|jgi:hypothetical protein
MDNNDNNTLEKKQFFLDSIAKFCDKCGTPYTTEDINIIQNTRILAIIHFSCHNCKSKNMATFVAPLGISNRVPINTDLTVKEIKKFANRKEVSPEEILDIYIKLKEESKIFV